MYKYFFSRKVNYKNALYMLGYIKKKKNKLFLATFGGLTFV